MMVYYRGLKITNTVLGVPYYFYGMMVPKPHSNDQGPYKDSSTDEFNECSGIRIQGLKSNGVG